MNVEQQEPESKHVENRSADEGKSEFELQKLDNATQPPDSAKSEASSSLSSSTKDDDKEDDSEHLSSSTEPELILNTDDKGKEPDTKIKPVPLDEIDRHEAAAMEVHSYFSERFIEQSGNMNESDLAMSRVVLHRVMKKFGVRDDDKRTINSLKEVVATEISVAREYLEHQKSKYRKDLSTMQYMNLNSRGMTREQCNAWYLFTQSTLAVLFGGAAIAGGYFTYAAMHARGRFDSSTPGLEGSSTQLNTTTPSVTRTQDQATIEWALLLAAAGISGLTYTIGSIVKTCVSAGKEIGEMGFAQFEKDREEGAVEQAPYQTTIDKLSDDIKSAENILSENHMKYRPLLDAVEKHYEKKRSEDQALLAQAPAEPLIAIDNEEIVKMREVVTSLEAKLTTLREFKRRLEAKRDKIAGEYKIVMDDYPGNSSSDDV